MVIIGVILTVIGFILRHLLARRAFYRRNEAGVEEFKSYTSAAVTHFFEKIGYFIAGILLIVGLSLIVVGVMGIGTS